DRHPDARPAPDLRALLSRGSRALARDGWDRPRALHRQARGGEPGREDYGAKRARTGLDVHGSPPTLALGPTLYPSRVTVLLLIRHAVPDGTGKRLSGRTPGIHLSPDGRRQAEALAERLSAVPIAAIYSSPLERCVETAEVLGRRRGLEVQLLPQLEEVAYGR